MRETAELRLEREGEMRERFKAPEEERKEECRKVKRCTVK